jgi:hypothetical protein
VRQDLSVLIGGVRLKFLVQKIFESDDLQRYRVYGANKTIVLQTNQKLFQRKGLKYRKGMWVLIEGTITNARALEQIILAIENLQVQGSADQGEGGGGDP